MTILTMIDTNHEILRGIVSDVPETAQRAGDREARKYRAMGHACECVGVVEDDVEIMNAVGLEITVPTDTMGMHYSFRRSVGIRTRKVFHPVLSPPIPTGEEE